jgi:hypothetical protein
MILELSDLTVFVPDFDPVKAGAMIDDAVAQAKLVAPCLADGTVLTPDQRDQFRAVLRGAVLRWHDAGAGGVVTTMDTTGPFTHQETVDSTANRFRRGLFWPAEIDLLRQACGRGRPRAATVDLAPDLPDCDPLRGARVNGPLGAGPGGL